MSQRLEEWLASPAATKLLGWLTLILVVTMLVLAGLTIPDIRTDTSASRRTDTIAGCRAQYRADVDDATVALFDAQSDVQSAISAAVVASINQDPTTLGVIAADLEAAEAVKDEAVTALFEANDRYRSAVALSSDDPDRFLQRCAERGA